MIGIYETWSSFRDFNRFSWVGAGTGMVLAVFFCVINYLVRRRFYTASIEATEIFRALGYSDPANVNTTSWDYEGARAHLVEDEYVMWHA